MVVGSYARASDTGRKRRRNEDSYVVLPSSVPASAPAKPPSPLLGVPRRAYARYSRSVENVISVEPTVKASPESSFARFTRFPFTSTPFVESRSTIQ